MFSQEERVCYRRNPLAEVICQIRFPEILTIEANAPAEFQEAIRDVFPHYSLRRENPAPKFTGAPGNITMEPQPAVNNYQFVSADGLWKINLTSRFLSLSCRSYANWESFAAKLDQPLAAFIRIYRPAMFTRVGLRYVNFISRKALDLEEVPFSNLIQPQYLGILADDEIQEGATARSTVDAEFAVRGGCRAKLHAGPGLVRRSDGQDQELKFIFDLDLFMDGSMALQLSAGALQTLHSQAYPIFRGAITDVLHEAMNPERI